MFKRIANTKTIATAALLSTGAGAGYYFAKKQESFEATPLAFADEKIPLQGLPGTKRTFIAIKPDGYERALTGEVIKRFETKGYQLVGIKILVPDNALLEQHYADLKGKPFFNGLIKLMTSGPVVAMVFQGKEAAKQGRALIGATNPLASAPGTIRGDYCIDLGRNAIHGSDSPQSAQEEIALWFKPHEVVSGNPRLISSQVYEK